MLLYRAELRRERRNQARLIESVAMGYGGCQSKDGHRAMERAMAALRKE